MTNHCPFCKSKFTSITRKKVEGRKDPLESDDDCKIFVPDRQQHYNEDDLNNVVEGYLAAEDRLLRSTRASRRRITSRSDRSPASSPRKKHPRTPEPPQTTGNSTPFLDLPLRPVSNSLVAPPARLPFAQRLAMADTTWKQAGSHSNTHTIRLPQPESKKRKSMEHPLQHMSNQKQADRASGRTMVFKKNGLQPLKDLSATLSSSESCSPEDIQQPQQSKGKENTRPAVNSAKEVFESITTKSNIDKTYQKHLQLHAWSIASNVKTLLQPFYLANDITRERYREIAQTVTAAVLSDCNQQDLFKPLSLTPRR